MSSDQPPRSLDELRDQSSAYLRGETPKPDWMKVEKKPLSEAHKLTAPVMNGPELEEARARLKRYQPVPSSLSAEQLERVLADHGDEAAGEPASFLEDWAMAAVQWLAAATVLTLMVGLIVALSHGMAWIGRTYGGVAVAIVAVVLAATVVAVGSALQVWYKRMPATTIKTPWR